MKDIPGYEGHYAITENGKVWSHKRKKFLAPYRSGHGYHAVQLCVGGKRAIYKVHRLVALTYIPNPDNLPQVGHKDETRINNCVSNLYWTTQLENNNYGSHNARVAKAFAKPVRCIELGKVFESISAAAREMKLEVTKICYCCRGKRITHGGYHWEYV